MHEVSIISLRFGRGLGRMPPLGALSLAAAIGQSKTSWSILDTQFFPEMHPFALGRLTDLILGCDSPIVAISLFNDALPLVIATIDAVADKLNGRKIWLGGPGVVGVAAQLMTRLPAIDAVVVGEGETAIQLLLRGQDSELPIPGVFKRSSSGWTGFGRTEREDLNDIALPPWDWCRGRGYDRVPLSTMRGCPFSCQFCEVIAFLGRRVTAMRIDRALDDLERAMALIGTNRVEILDDTFTVNRKRVLSFCRQLLSRNLEVEFSIFARSDTVDCDIVNMLADAGCRRVFVGVDAGDDEVLQRITKGIQCDDAFRAICMVADRCEVTASFIWGYPFESLKSVRKTIDFARRLCDANTKHRITPQLHLLSPSAGTPIHEEWGGSLTLDLDSFTLPLTGSLGDWSCESGAQEVQQIIRDEPLLAAPFYRYQTEDFEEKQALVGKLNYEI